MTCRGFVPFISTLVAIACGCSRHDTDADTWVAHDSKVPSISDDQLSKHCFVRGVVESIEDNQGPTTKIQFAVADVFVGTRCHVGDNFFAIVAAGNHRGQSMSNVIAFHPPLIVGDEVLWSIKHPGQTLVSRANTTVLGLRTYDGGFCVRLPIRLTPEVDSRTTKSHIALARETKRIRKLDPNHRWNKVAELCFSKHNPVSGWAMMVLVTVSPNDARDVLIRVLEAAPANELSHHTAREQLKFIDRFTAERERMRNTERDRTSENRLN